MASEQEPRTSALDYSENPFENIGSFGRGYYRRLQGCEYLILSWEDICRDASTGVEMLVEIQKIVSKTFSSLASSK
jgi:hypothetical protein